MGKLSGDPEQRWFTIYVHTCDADPRGGGERPTDGKQYVGQAMHSLRDIERGFPDVAKRAMMARWSHKQREESVLSRAVQRFGAENFRHDVLDVVFGQTAANKAEGEWATKLDCYEPRGYNRRKAGQQYRLSHEEHSEFCKRGWAAIPVEQKMDSIRRGQKTLGPKGLSLRSTRRAVTMGPKKLSASISKGHVTRGPDGQAAAIAKRIENMDFFASSRKAMVTMGPEGLRGRANSVWDSRWAKALKLAEESGDYEAVEKIRANIDADMRVRQLSTADVQRLLELLIAGAALKDLAKDLRVTYMALYRALRRVGWHGKPIRQRPIPPPGSF